MDVAGFAELNRWVDDVDVAAKSSRHGLTAMASRAGLPFAAFLHVPSGYHIGAWRGKMARLPLAQGVHPYCNLGTAWTCLVCVCVLQALCPCSPFKCWRETPRTFNGVCWWCKQEVGSKADSVL